MLEEHFAWFVTDERINTYREEARIWRLVRDGKSSEPPAWRQMMTNAAEALDTLWCRIKSLALQKQCATSAAV